VLTTESPTSDLDPLGASTGLTNSTNQPTGATQNATSVSTAASSVGTGSTNNNNNSNNQRPSSTSFPSDFLRSPVTTGEQQHHSHHLNHHQQFQPQQHQTQHNPHSYSGINQSLGSQSTHSHLQHQHNHMMNPHQQQHQSHNVQQNQMGYGSNVVAGNNEHSNSASSMSSYLGSFPAAAAASFFYSQLYLNDFDSGCGSNSGATMGNGLGTNGHSGGMGLNHSGSSVIAASTGRHNSGGSSSGAVAVGIHGNIHGHPLSQQHGSMLGIERGGQRSSVQHQQQDGLSVWRPY